MLKIKDNVNLIELEKFGFKLVVNSDNNRPLYYRGWLGELEITIGMDGRFYRIETWSGNEFGRLFQDDALDKLFDLIQAGLVEKCK